MPPLGMLFAWMVLGEHVAFRDLLGIVPVALGIYLVTRPASAPARRQESVDEFAAYYAHRRPSEHHSTRWGSAHAW
jgi:hypothetical protein